MNTGLESVVQRMQVIRSTFREVQDLFSGLDEGTELVSKLQSYPLIFRSIAYEAASMQIALKEIKNGLALNKWQAFVNTIGAKHITQCYIGLGWALAQEQLTPSDFLSISGSGIENKSYDGYGYYEGMFRRRRSVLSQQLPDFLDESTAPSYYRGLGRSLWYSSNADIEQIARIISGFPDVVKSSLWTGLGTAIAYVGGCNTDNLKQILSIAGDYAAALKNGAQAAAISRDLAETDLSEAVAVISVFDEQKGKALEVAKSFLGKETAVIFDRPLGSVHPEFGFVYALNYGYVPGTEAADGEEIDAYLIGAGEPLQQATATCVAIIHRFNEGDDKLVLAPAGNKLTKEEIRQATAFQEQWFESIIITL